MTTEQQEQDAKTEAKEELREARETVDKIVPNKETREWTFGTGQNQVTFKQRRLSFFNKVEFFSLLGQTIEMALEGNEHTLSSLLSSAGLRTGQVSMADMADADSFIKGMARLATVAPDFLAESYCIWLGVPRGDRPYVKTLMEQPEDEGGLTDEQGFEIIETFVDQNWDSLENFFRGKLPALVRRVQTLRSQNQS